MIQVEKSIIQIDQKLYKKLSLNYVVRYLLYFAKQKIDRDVLDIVSDR